jgi:hypothetical protein
VSRRHALLAMYRDAQREKYFTRQERWKPYLDQNAITLLQVVPTKVCIVTLETRSERYAALHDQNIAEYIEKQKQLHPEHEYVYKRLWKCEHDRFPHTHNIYWCKLFVVRELLESDRYDYVMWLDSDTILTDSTVDFARVLRSYESHFYAGFDHSDFFDGPGRYDYINAGVFIVRNSKVGKKMMRMLTELFNSSNFQRMCVDPSTKALKGMWSGSCYEQGAMNEILERDFRTQVTILPRRYVWNGHICSGDFIVHLMRGSSEERERCFHPYVKNKNVDHKDNKK